MPFLNLFKNILLKTSAFFIIAVLLITNFFNVPTFAQNSGFNLQDLQFSDIRCILPIDGCSAEETFINQIISLLQTIAPFIATLVIMVGAYEWFYDKGLKKTEATLTIITGALGFIIILLAEPITKVLTETFQAQEAGGAAFNPQPLIDFINQFTDFLLTISTAIAVIVIVVGGYFYFADSLSGKGGNPGEQARGAQMVIGGATGLIIIIFARPIVAIIQDTFGVTDSNDIALQTNPIATVIQTFLGSLLIPLSSVVAVFLLVVGGYFWITSNGDEQKVEKAQNALKGAVIGFIIVILSTTVVQLIQFFVNPAAINAPTNVSTPSVNTPSPSTPSAPDPFGTEI